MTPDELLTYLESELARCRDDRDRLRAELENAVVERDRALQRFAARGANAGRGRSRARSAPRCGARHHRLKELARDEATAPIDGIRPARDRGGAVSVAATPDSVLPESVHARAHRTCWRGPARTPRSSRVLQQGARSRSSSRSRPGSPACTRSRRPGRWSSRPGQRGAMSWRAVPRSRRGSASSSLSSRQCNRWRESCSSRTSSTTAMSSAPACSGATASRWRRPAAGFSSARLCARTRERIHRHDVAPERRQVLWVDRRAFAARRRCADLYGAAARERRATSSPRPTGAGAFRWRAVA